MNTEQATAVIENVNTPEISAEKPAENNAEKAPAQAEKPPASERVKKPLPTNWTLLAIFSGFIGYAILQANTGTLDSDLWWLMATGREIVENGFPYVNPWSMFDDLGIVIQQWLAAVSLYATYCAFGFLGLKFLVLFECVVLTLVLFAVCRVISGRRDGSGEVFAFIIAVAMFSLTSYTTVRPHVLTMTLYLLTVLFLEKYRHTNNYLWLFALPIIACLHVNVQASMAPMHLVLIALYFIPNFPAFISKKKKIENPKLAFYLSDYKRLPLLLALLGASAFMLINPYSINGAVYVWLSYGVASYGDYISEMGHTTFWTDYGAATMAMIVLGAVALGKRGLKSIDVPLSCIFLASIPVSMMHVRSVWIVALFAVLLCASAFKDVRVNLEKMAKFTGKALPHLAVILVAAIVATGWYTSQKWVDDANNAEKDSTYVPSEAMNYLDAYTQQRGVEKSSLKIYNQYNNGGYLEWRGYPVFIDARAEIWGTPITQNIVDYYKSYVDAEDNSNDQAGRLSSYDFDFCLAINNTNIANHLAKAESHKLVLTGSGYKLYARADIDTKVEGYDTGEDEEEVDLSTNPKAIAMGR